MSFASSHSCGTSPPSVKSQLVAITISGPMKEDAGRQAALEREILRSVAVVSHLVHACSSPCLSVSVSHEKW